MVRPYREIDDKALDLWPTGMSTPAIAASCGVEPDDIERLVKRARYRGDPRAAARGVGRRKTALLSVPSSAAEALAAEASRRRIGVDILAALLLVRIAADSMVGAILDDGLEAIPETAGAAQ